MDKQNYITKVAVVGAGGNSGRHMSESLLSTGKHVVTAISRMDSESQLPTGVIIKKVDYQNQQALVEALTGQDALVITLSGHTPKDIEMQLVEAAGEAGVRWILPNEWSPDTANDALVKDVFFLQSKIATRKAITDLGKSSYIAVSTGFWYEWMLGMAPAFGFDFANRSVTFFDEGETKISLSTWSQLGRAVAALLSLPIAPEASNQKACLENFKNQVVYVNSFTVSQKDMFDSVLRVTDTKKEDWTVTKEKSEERFSQGLQEMKQGQRIGFAKLATRLFYPDGCGDFEHNKGTLNQLLNLPKEDLDEQTKLAIRRQQATDWSPR